MAEEPTVDRESIPAAELPEYASTAQERPTLATVREIDFSFDPDKNELDFFFSRADFRTPVNATSLVPLLRRIRDDDEFGWDDTNLKEPREPYASRLSLRNQDWCYVIFRLADGKKWQFCRDQPPFTLGKKALKAERYREARRFELNSTLSKLVPDETGVNNFKPPMDGSRVAYFIADNRNSGNFENHGFNIHVDLLYEDRRLRLPIVIDPDIRYPGGSGA